MNEDEYLQKQKEWQEQAKQKQKDIATRKIAEQQYEKNKKYEEDEEDDINQIFNNRLQAIQRHQDDKKYSPYEYYMNLMLNDRMAYISSILQQNFDTLYKKQKSYTDSQQGKRWEKAIIDFLYNKDHDLQIFSPPLTTAPWDFSFVIDGYQFPVNVKSDKSMTSQDIGSLFIPYYSLYKDSDINLGILKDGQYIQSGNQHAVDPVRPLLENIDPSNDLIKDYLWLVVNNQKKIEPMFKFKELVQNINWDWNNTKFTANYSYPDENFTYDQNIEQAMQIFKDRMASSYINNIKNGKITPTEKMAINIAKDQILNNELLKDQYVGANMYKIISDIEDYQNMLQGDFKRYNYPQIMLKIMRQLAAPYVDESMEAVDLELQFLEELVKLKHKGKQEESEQQEKSKKKNKK